MRRFHIRYVLPGLLLLLVGTGLGMELETYVSGTDTIEQLRKLEDAFLIINQRYVEDVDAAALTEAAIEAMLDELDPHSSYISAEEIAEVQEGYQGAFGGIGIWFEPVDDTSRVVSTISGGPSEAIGLLPGDRIIGVDDTSAVGFTSNDIQRHLKGPIGTEVRVTIKRPGVRKPMEFTIERGRIPLYSVDAGYMLDDATGYIKISRFAMTTHEEFVSALTQLRERGMERLVIDLRSNPGGIMQSAVAIADEMLGGHQVVVSTRGRTPGVNDVHRSTPRGAFESEPVIVLVNENSASASEILAGALQDHDRALIVGRRTFGKGLVQNQFPLPDGAVLQMTTARYYTPAGRLIQTPYDSGDAEDYYEEKFSSLEKATFSPAEYLETIPDSLTYHTDRGRLVFGGGGIMPDFVIPPDTTSALGRPLVRSVLNANLDLLFVRKLLDTPEGRAIRDEWDERLGEFVDTWDVDEMLWTQFWAFADEAADEQRLQLTDDASAVKPSENVYARATAEADRATLSLLLKARLAQRLFGSEMWYPVIREVDHELNESLLLWQRAEALAAYHAAEGDPGKAHDRND